MASINVNTNDTAMSYPLKKLPYGLRRRLRELATPLETYSLQVAGPEFKYFQPIQECRRQEIVSFYRDFDNEVKLNLNEDGNCEIVTETVYITDVATDDLKLLLESVRLEMEILDITQCEFTSTFLQTVANAVQKSIKELNIKDSVVQSCDEKNVAQTICNATSFKKLEIFAVDDGVIPLSKWFDAMLKANFINLQYFYLSKVTPALLDVNAETLLKFVKAQEDFREFAIHVKGSDFEVVNSLVEQRFGKYFHLEADKSVLRMVLSIKEGQ